MNKPILIFTSVGFGIAAFIIAFLLGTGLTATTGIPLLGGVLNGVFTAMVLTIGLLALPYFGSATVMWLVFSLMAVMTTTLGPQGLYKVLIGVIAGLLWDIIYKLLKQKRSGLYLGALVGSASIMFTLVLFLTLGYGKNSIEALTRYQNSFFVILIINLVVTLIGVILGDIVYNKRLAHLESFKNLHRKIVG